MEPEQEHNDDHELAKFEVFENLRKKDTYTPLTLENFTEWNMLFMRAIRSKQKKEKKRQKNKVDMKKASGREIFQEAAIDLLFIGDEVEKEDEEEEDVQVDEDLFGGEDADLDELDF